MAICAGGAVVAGGIGIALWANATASEERNSVDPNEKPALRDAAYTRATIADVTMGVGAALVVTGVILRVTSRSRAVPAITMGAGTASARWSFDL